MNVRSAAAIIFDGFHRFNVSVSLYLFALKSIIFLSSSLISLDFSSSFVVLKYKFSLTEYEVCFSIHSASVVTKVISCECFTHSYTLFCVLKGSINNLYTQNKMKILDFSAVILLCTRSQAPESIPGF